MMLKLYTDTHIAKQVAVQLRNRGVDIVRCEEVNMAEASDEEHLEYAAQEGRSLVSIDKHFRKWHAKWQEEGKAHAGLFCLSKELQGKDAIGRIVTALFEYHQMVTEEAADLELDIYNQIIYLR